MPDEWIRQWGDPALRQLAHPITSFDDLLRARIKRLARSLVAAEGAGLAATQVGVLQRAFVYREFADDEVHALINPRITRRSDEMTTFVEGCLSFNTVLVAVERPVAVRVEAYTPEGEQIRIDAEGYLASLLQHEIDHLDGILTLDRASAEERRRVVMELQDQQHVLGVVRVAHGHRS